MIKESDVVVGREYVWMPDSPAARVSVVVMEIRHVPNGDVRVFTKNLESRGINQAGDQNWNDMSRFLEACVPASNTGAAQQLLPG